MKTSIFLTAILISLNLFSQDEMPLETVVQLGHSWVTLDLKATDSKYNLSYINVSVNDVPVFGTKGIDINKSSSSDFEESVKILLSEGDNRIQVSVKNTKGTESLKQTTYIKYSPKKTEKHNLYIVSIGVSEHDNSDINLTYAAKDAKDILTLFANNKEKYNKIIEIPLINENATKENIVRTKETLKESKVDDHVIIFYAGHGVLDDDYNYFLAVKEIDISNICETALPYEELELLTDGIPARKKIILIDACHSGEDDNEGDSPENESLLPVHEML